MCLSRGVAQTGIKPTKLFGSKDVFSKEWTQKEGSCSLPVCSVFLMVANCSTKESTRSNTTLKCKINEHKVHISPCLHSFLSLSFRKSGARIRCNYIHYCCMGLQVTSSCITLHQITSQSIRLLNLSESVPNRVPT